jgi:2-(1,2-epoxy-1,2-dihydrophenyl)acetyl-CoA isomerase
MPDEKLRYELDGHIATVTLNRPAVLNALDGELLEQLGRVCGQVDADPAVRVVLFTGAGRAFCAGGDIKAVSFADSGGRAPARDPKEHWAAKLLAVRKPTVAVVNGIAAGGGLALALACDLRIASEQARFSAIFARIGMSVLDGAGWLLPRAVGVSKALELLFSAEQIDAAEAARIGLVGQVVPHPELMSRARELAARIAANPPVALELSKGVVLDAEGQTFEEHLPLQWAAQRKNFELARHDIAEGGRAFAEKREPRFRGREEEP